MTQFKKVVDAVGIRTWNYEHQACHATS